ncbi:MAG TPA: peptidyl-alpha-hydroxyglycine alpha-amidating lyase family protein [Vicinamibacterales bacterium]|jgi:sugar lactone lactonase YvrE|nr:peptidyl-alpha-hydroxyglycine alpha-amidating lyase family protein [Vicinamibacterales bacterium]
MAFSVRRRGVLAAVVVLLLAHDSWSEGSSYQLVEDFFKLPAGRKIGSTAGITVDRDGRSIWAFDRCGDQNCVGSDVAPIQKFDATGRLVKSFGAGMFVRPHGIHVDRDGNVWVTDGEGPDGKDPRRNGKGHQVFKFSPDGKLLMTLGTAGVAGEGRDTFNMPSAVLVAPNGDIFVGDGHGGTSNARIVKFSKDGTFIKTWGKKGAGPGDFDAQGPHALAMDSRGRLFVGDRGNNRIQIFDQDGRFLEEWRQFGRPSGVFIDRNDILYVADHQSTPQTNPGFTPGIRIGSVKDAKVVTFIPETAAEPSQENVAADAAGNVYGSLTGGMALRRYVRK